MEFEAREVQNMSLNTTGRATTVVGYHTSCEYNKEKGEKRKGNKVLVEGFSYLWPNDSLRIRIASRHLITDSPEVTHVTTQEYLSPLLCNYSNAFFIFNHLSQKIIILSSQVKLPKTTLELYHIHYVECNYDHSIALCN